MTWPEATAAFERTSVAVIPIESTEQHGPHLPVGTGSGCWPGLLGVEATYLSKSSSRRVCVSPYGVRTVTTAVARSSCCQSSVTSASPDCAARAR
jgi:creatinine amidohydrolase/Fe(II)-dependent formamide hydrolase-like protein